MQGLDQTMLVLFSTLWDTRSVTATAARMDLSQSSVSAALARLRETFGDRLFVWDGHRMTPTPRASAVIADVRSLLQAMTSLLAPQPTNAASFDRHFVIATADYMAATCGPPLLARCLRDAPGLVAEFVDVRPDMLNKGGGVGIDFFLMPDSRLQTAGLKSTPLYTDRYVCLAREDNALLEAAMDDADAFLALPHVGYSSVQRVVFSHETNALENGHTPAYRIVGPHYLAFALIAARSDAVAIVPSRVAEVLAGVAGLTVHPVPMTLPPISMSLYWDGAADQDPAHAWLRQTIVETLGDASGSLEPNATIDSP